MSEKRRSVRAHTLVSGRVVILPSGNAVPCVVHDLSPEGAHIELDDVKGLGGLIALYVGTSPSAYLGRVLWVRAPSVGVRFLERRPTPEVLPD
jgi:hypothetical protein